MVVVVVQQQDSVKVHNNDVLDDHDDDADCDHLGEAVRCDDESKNLQQINNIMKILCKFLKAIDLPNLFFEKHSCCVRTYINSPAIAHKEIQNASL